MSTREKKILKQTKILGGYDSSKYVSYRYWATSDDGTKIPISWVGPRETQGKPIPTLLYGYGSYGITVDPSFFCGSAKSVTKRDGFRHSACQRRTVYGSRMVFKW
ncbi:MAG: hypothetical protein ACJ0QP_05030 [Schleiferiaceae bacterium]